MAGGGSTACSPRRTWATEELTRLAGSPDHQGVVAEVDPYPYADPGSLLDADDALVVALDQVQDPRNLGAICRSAEAAGASGVVMPERRAAAITAAACKASAGAVEHLAVARVREPRATGCSPPRRTAPGSTEPTPGPKRSTRRRIWPTAGWSWSSAARGRACGGGSPTAATPLVSIPVGGAVGSLNVSAAAAVLLFEATRQRRVASGVPDATPNLQRPLQIAPRGVDRTTRVRLDCRA